MMKAGKPKPSRMLVVAAALLAGCTTMRPAVEYDEEADFSSFETFTWRGPDPLRREGAGEPLDPEMESRLQEIAKAMLSQRGLRFVEDPNRADLAAAFTIRTRTGAYVTEFPTPDFTRSWSREWHSDISIETAYTDGRLIIELFDAASGRRVWRGEASRRIPPGDRADLADHLRESARDLLAEFPPR